MSSRSPYGHPLSTNTGGTVARADMNVATVAALKAIAADDARRTNGNEVILANGSRWYFHSTSALTGDDIVVVAPTAGTGRWLRQVGFVDLAIPIAYTLANNATIWTVPTGVIFKLESAHWEVTTAWAGGSSSAIGITATGHTTDGDILGGASGDVEATLTTGRKAGTVGAKMDSDSELHSMLFVATNTFHYDEVTSAFTSGAGYAHLVGYLLANAGA